MKRLLIASLALLGGSALAQQDVPTIPFEGNINFLQMPKDMYLGEATGVATDAKGNVYVLNRGNTSGPAYGAAATQLLEIGRAHV